MQLGSYKPKFCNFILSPFIETYVWDVKSSLQSSPGSPALQTHSLPSEPSGKPRNTLESGVAQSCPTLCNPMVCSLPGSSMYGIFQARILEWVALSFFKECLAAAAAKSLQSCRTLCDPRDSSPPIPVILQSRTLEWVAISFSNAWKWKVKVKSRSRVWLLATPWTAAYQAPPSMGFSRQEYWSGVHTLHNDNCI